jgi:hypothetical protein
MRFPDMLTSLYSGLIALLTATLLTGHLLGFAGVYTPLPALLLLPLLLLLLYRAYRRDDPPWTTPGTSTETRETRTLKRVLLLSAGVIFGVVFAWRMITYPFSEFGALIPADFINYHAIKAVDLAYYGTVWNLNIPYGQYPVGYETLVAFPLLLTGHLHDSGLVHLLITLTLWLTLYGLLRRYTRFSPALALSSSLALFFVPLIYSQVVVIGKNDVLLALSVLMAILHAPVGLTGDTRWHPVGLACATLISIATKGSGLYVLVLLWGFALYQAWRDWQQKQPSLRPGQLLLLVLLMFPGGWWVLRNIAIMGQPYSPEVSNFFQTSILANLSNPALYDMARGLDTLLLWLAAALLLTLLLAWNQRFSWRALLLLLVLIVNYLATPLSAFDTIERNMLNIEWRFLVLPLLMMLIVAIALLSPLLERVYMRVNQHRAGVLAASGLVIAASAGLLLLLDAPYFLNPANLRDESPFAYPPNSIYACVDDRLDSGTVYLENTNGFYLRYHNPELRFTAGNAFPLRMPDVYNPPPPDYAVFIQVVPDIEMQFRYLQYLDEPLAWEIICEHESGILYRRAAADNPATE